MMADRNPPKKQSYVSAQTYISSFLAAHMVVQLLLPPKRLQACRECFNEVVNQQRTKKNVAIGKKTLKSIMSLFVCFSISFHI